MDMLNAASGTAKAARPQQPDSELANRFVQADNALTRLHDRLTALESRLIPVLTPPQENAAGSHATAAATANLSPFGRAIQDLENRADYACHRVEALLRELAI